MKSHDYLDGFCQSMVFLSDIFESHSKAFIRKGLLREKDIKMIVNIIDACIRRRETIAEVGPRQMNLIVHPDRTVELTERYSKNDST